MQNGKSLNLEQLSVVKYLPRVGFEPTTRHADAQWLRN